MGGWRGAWSNRHFAAADVSCLSQSFSVQPENSFPFYAVYIGFIAVSADCADRHRRLHYGIIGGVIVFAFNHQILSIIGTSGVVSYTVMTYVYNLVLMAFVGIAQGCQPLVSYAVGQQDSKRSKLVYRYAATAVALIFGAAKPWLLDFYAADRFGLHPAAGNGIVWQHGSGVPPVTTVF